MTVDYAYYSETYGGGLSEAAFGDSLPLAEAHVRWLCSVRGACSNSTAYKRAVCAAAEAFAEFGMGEVGGYSIGKFSVKNFENADNESVVTKAAIKELAGTPYIFCGIR